MENNYTTKALEANEINQYENQCAEKFRNNKHYYITTTKEKQVVLIHFYNEEKGVYEIISENAFKGIIKAGIPKEIYRPSIVDNIYKNLLTDPPGSLHLANIEDFNTNENLINFKNGILNLEKNTFYQHTPQFLSTIQIPFEFPLNTSPLSCPAELDRFLKHCFGNDEKQINLFFQLIGVAISNIDASKSKKAIFIYGDKNTGKSKLRDLMIHLVGEDNSCSIDLNQLSKRFGASSLYQKRIAGCGDMSSDKIKDPSIFKQLTGGDQIQMEFKHKNPFSAKFRGLLVFSTNTLPSFCNESDDFLFERMCILKTVGKTAEKGTPCPVDCVYRDNQLFNKITTDKCISYILFRAVKALREYIGNGYTFSTQSKNDTYLKEYIEIHRSVEAFISNCCIKSSDTSEQIDHFTVSDIYGTYTTWCSMSVPQKIALDKKEFNTKLCSLGLGIIQRNNGHHCFAQFTLNKNTREQFDVQPITRPMTL